MSVAAPTVEPDAELERGRCAFQQFALFEADEVMQRARLGRRGDSANVVGDGEVDQGHLNALLRQRRSERGGAEPAGPAPANDHNAPQRLIHGCRWRAQGAAPQWLAKNASWLGIAATARCTRSRVWLA